MTRNFVWAVAATLAAVATAAAEPVPVGATPPAWTLGSVVTTPMGTGELEMGPFTVTNSAGAPTTMMAIAPMPTGMTATAMTGDATGLRVATASKSGYTLGELFPADARDSVFTVTLSLTDAASGQTGELVFTGLPTLTLGPAVDSPGALTLGFEGSGVQSVTLGGLRYDVRLGTGGSDTESYLTADVTCTHDAPEPATLALAAVGLLGAAGLRMRRR